METEKLDKGTNRRGNDHIFKPKYKTRSGEIRESKFFYIQFYRNGVRYVENTRTDKITPAKSLLRRRLGSEQFVPPKLEKLTFDELAASVLNDYEKNERSSLSRVRQSIFHLTKFFRGQRAININGAMASEYAVLRRRRPGAEGARDGISTGAAIATINRELAALRRMFNLGKKESKVRFVLPTISLTKENNVRKGFLDHNQYRELRGALPDYARSVLVAMYYTGMRIGEALAIQWDHVDIAEREIRLEPGTTKNDEARTLPLHGELLEVIQIQREIHDRKHPACQRVFSHGGKPIKNLYKAWRTACVKVGLGRIVCAVCSGEIGESGACARCSSKVTKYVGLIPHDLRRTGVRNLIRAGVPQSVAMRISGHKTASVFRRYDITSTEDLRDAAWKLTRYLESKNSQSTTKVTVAPASSENQKPASLLN